MTPPIPPRSLDALQARLRHFFGDRTLLVHALTHPSAAVEAGQTRLASYERLEFLGDALLNAWVAELLFDRFPDAHEGVLTRLRSFWISGPVLAGFARGLQLERHVELGTGEERDGGRTKERILASVLEALFAALYLDAGPKKPRSLARALWADDVRRRGLAVLSEDAKTGLQELRQAEGVSRPEYRVSSADGGFEATVLLDGEAAGRGAGATKKAAEQAAAKDALARLADGMGRRKRAKELHALGRTRREEP